MQLTFGDAEQQSRRKRIRRVIFLSEMEQVVPWKRCWRCSSRTTQRQAAQAGSRIHVLCNLGEVREKAEQRLADYYTEIPRDSLGGLIVAHSYS